MVTQMFVEAVLLLYQITEFQGHFFLAVFTNKFLRSSEVFSFSFSAFSSVSC